MAVKEITSPYPASGGIAVAACKARLTACCGALGAVPFSYAGASFPPR